MIERRKLKDFARMNRDFKMRESSKYAHDGGWSDDTNGCFINHNMAKMFDGVTVFEFESLGYDAKGKGRLGKGYTHRCSYMGQTWSFSENWFVSESEDVLKEILDEEMFEI